MRATDATRETGGLMPPSTVAVWDRLVRMLHWALVALFAFAFATGDALARPHEIAGYAIAGLIGLRVIWGFLGPRYARFLSFLHPPSTVAAFLRDTLALKARRYLGHNPAGGWMVIALLLALAAISVTGAMMSLSGTAGDGWITDAHEASAYTALGLVAMHMGGVVVASLEHGENLVRAMISGRKRAPGPHDID